MFAKYYIKIKILKVKNLFMVKSIKVYKESEAERWSLPVFEFKNIS